MKLMSFQKQNNKSAFALLYVMLFIFLILVTVVITWATSMAENRLNQRTEGGAEAYQLAQAAIDDGWIKYHDLIGDRCVIDDVTEPATGIVNRYFVKDDTSKEVNLKNDPVSLGDSLKGVYDFRINKIGTQEVIEGIGYYRGTKITLKGEVNHNEDVEHFDDLVDPTLCTSIDHTKDTLFIYQTGPSGS